MDPISLIISSLALGNSIYFKKKSSNVTRIATFYDSLEKINELIITYPELEDLFNNKKKNEIEIDERFFSRIKAFTYMYLNMFENVYIQLLSKKKPEEQKQAWKDTILERFESKLFEEIWNKSKNLFDKSFVDYIDKLLSHRI